MSKVAVYAICKNESMFVDRWVDSVSEADEIVVLDTGSTDDTVEKLRSRGIHVVCEDIVPWRFDSARNRSLELVGEDADICVCVDLDEILTPGWRTAVEEAWANGAERLEYRYVWSFNPDGSEGVVFWISKIHARHGFQWINPVHEVLACDHECRTTAAEGMQVEHHPDQNKSRAQYLPLLELAVEEDPHNDRNMHYLGREYMFRGRWEDCIRTLERHVSMPEARWDDEKCASYRFMARAWENLDRGDNAEKCLYNAMALAPHLREPFIDAALFCMRSQVWDGTAFFARRALAVTNREHTYITEAESWGALPYDILAVALFYTGRAAEALTYARKAHGISPEDERIRNNLKLIEEAARA